jgi:hypothetical protein
MARKGKSKVDNNPKDSNNDTLFIYSSAEGRGFESRCGEILNLDL